MNKEQTKKALLAPNKSLIALGYEGLVYWRMVAQEWVNSDFDYILHSGSGQNWRRTDEPEWCIDSKYQLSEPEQWDCGIDFCTSCVANAKCYLVGEEFYQEAVKLKPLIILNKLIEEKNKESGWVADWTDKRQKKYHIIYGNLTKNYYVSTDYFYNSIESINFTCENSANEICSMLNKGLVKGIEDEQY